MADNNSQMPVVIVGGGANKKLANYQAAVFRHFANGAVQVLVRGRGKAASLAQLVALSFGQLPGYECDDFAKVGFENGKKSTPVQFSEMHIRKS